MLTTVMEKTIRLTLLFQRSLRKSVTGITVTDFLKVKPMKSVRFMKPPPMYAITILWEWCWIMIQKAKSLLLSREIGFSKVMKLKYYSLWYRDLLPLLLRK